MSADAPEKTPAPVTHAAEPADHDHALNAFLKPLALDLDTLHELAYHFSKTYQHLALHSDEQFLPTPVTKLPTGQETGRYLAIDVGGTNLRVGFIELLGEDDANHAENSESDTGNERSRDALKKARRPRIRRTLEKAWPIGEHLKMDQAEDLFAWIGDCIAEVVSDSLKNESSKLVDIPDELDLGITFSFPMMFVIFIIYISVSLTSHLFCPVILLYRLSYIR
jgi:hexokinase